MQFSFYWVFGHPGLWSLYIFVWLALIMGFLAFNHLEKQEKILNTLRWLTVGAAFVICETGGEIANGEDPRSMLPLVATAWLMFMVITADWASYALYKSATHNHGVGGWIGEGILAVRVWGQSVRKKILGIKGLGAMALLVIVAVVLGGCNLQPPEYTPSPPQMTAGSLNSTYEAGTATARAELSTIGRQTVTPDSHVTVTPTVTMSVTPSATFTPSICELPTLGPGTYVLEVIPCP